MRIDFYVTPSDQTQARLALACRLTRKAWLAQLDTFIRCADTDQAQQIDTLLWTFRPEFFLPHNLYQDNAHAPIVIATTEPPVQQGAVLINLAMDLPQQTESIERIIEIVCQTPEQLQQSRENFIQYRRLGYNPQRVEL